MYIYFYIKLFVCRCYGTKINILLKAFGAFPGPPLPG